MHTATRAVLEFDFRNKVDPAYQLTMKVTEGLQTRAGREDHVHANSLLGSPGLAQLYVWEKTRSGPRRTWHNVVIKASRVAAESGLWPPLARNCAGSCGAFAAMTSRCRVARPTSSTARTV